MKRAVIAVCTAVALTGAAGGAQAAPAHPSAAKRLTLGVWLTRGGHLWQTKRTIASTPAVATAAVRVLLARPNAAESAAGVGTAVPAGTHLRGITIQNGLATVDLRRAYASPDTRKRAHMRLAQLAYTVTQFPTVRAVRLEVTGRAVTTLAGVPVPRRLTRSRYPRLLPPILVWNPAIGARIPTSVRVSGTANVFEAVLHVKVFNARGRRLVKVRTMASCGTGCRGQYQVTVAYHVRRAQIGTVVVNDTGGNPTGRAPHIVRIPVHLTV